ncbi:MAG: hypothetical protein PVH62_02310 [Anaerolineae bacterium]|jgi:hypothetical protein
MERIRQFVSLGLLALLITLAAGCAGPSRNDAAVSDAYDQLVDVWPSGSGIGIDCNVTGCSAAEIYEEIMDASEVLVEAGEDADTPELGEAGQQVGQAAASFAAENAILFEQALVPFFDESAVGGDELSQMCEEIR